MYAANYRMLRDLAIRHAQVEQLGESLLGLVRERVARRPPPLVFGCFRHQLLLPRLISF